MSKEKEIEALFTEYMSWMKPSNIIEYLSSNGIDERVTWTDEEGKSWTIAERAIHNVERNPLFWEGESWEKVVKIGLLDLTEKELKERSAKAFILSLASNEMSGFVSGSFLKETNSSFLKSGKKRESQEIEQMDRILSVAHEMSKKEETAMAAYRFANVFIKDLFGADNYWSTVRKKMTVSSSKDYFPEEGSYARIYNNYNVYFGIPKHFMDNGYYEDALVNVLDIITSSLRNLPQENRLIGMTKVLPDLMLGDLWAMPDDFDYSSVCTDKVAESLVALAKAGLMDSPQKSTYADALENISPASLFAIRLLLEANRVDEILSLSKERDILNKYVEENVAAGSYMITNLFIYKSRDDNLKERAMKRLLNFKENFMGDGFLSLTIKKNVIKNEESTFKKTGP